MQNAIETLRESFLARVALIGLAIGWVPFYLLSMATASLQG